MLPLMAAKKTTDLNDIGRIVYRWNPDWQIETETYFSAYIRFLYLNFISDKDYKKYLKSGG